MTKKVLLKSLMVLGFLAAAVGLLWGSLKLHLPTAMGRAAAEDAIHHLASSRLRGRLHVDSVDVLRSDHVELSGFSAFDLDGVKVLELGHARADFDVSAFFFDNAVRMRNVHGYGAKIVIRHGRNHKVSISDVFDSKNPSSSDSRSKRTLDFGWMWAEDAQLDVRMSSRPLAFHIANASMKVERHGQAPVRVDLRGADGAMTRPSILGIGLRFVGMSGAIRPKTDEVVRLNSGACIGEEAMQVRIVYRPGPPKVARVVLDYESGLGFLMSLGFRVGDLINGPLEIDERELPGDPPSSCEGESLGGSDPDSDSDEDEDEDEDEDTDEAIDERLDDADEQLEEALEAAEDP